MSLQQSVQTKLLRKYDTDFNFYCAKAVNQIVFNQNLMANTIEYKDVAIFAENNQYLKRIYRMKNAAGRNQIYQRINMLADFYSNAILLRYEHPMMIISNTKDIFIKRLRRMKKMIASDCSSDQSSSQKSGESSQQISFQSSGFLHSIKTRDLSSKKNSLQQSSIFDKQKSESSYYNIYNQSLNQTPTKLKKLQVIKTQSIQTDPPKPLPSKQQQLAYLIIDIDDIDKQQILEKYEKIRQKQNNKTQLIRQDNVQQQNRQKDNEKQKKYNNEKRSLKKKSTIVITPIDYTPQQGLSEESFHKNSKQNPKKSRIQAKFVKKEHHHRDNDYDQTIRMGDKYIGKYSKYCHQGYLSKSPSSPYFTYNREKETQRNYIITHDRYQIDDDNKHSYANRRQQYLGPKTRLSNDQYDYIGVDQQQRKFKKKSQIRERAIALLNGVRSQQRDFRMSRIRHYDYEY